MEARWQKEHPTRSTATQGRRICTFLFKKFKPSVAAAVLKTWLNAACTTARFHQAVAPCPICGVCSGDVIEHLFSWSVVLDSAVAFWRCPVPCTWQDCCFLRGGGSLLDQPRSFQAAVHMFVTLKAYNTCRSTGQFAESLYTNTPIHQYTPTSIFQYTNTSIHQFTYTSLHPYTNTPIHQYTNTSIH